ncbi:HAD family hydrolase [Enhygromyxa salina]|uniref:NLI interacting factor-like phosphatase n=1 Tax=Enhygromyxa salina TaxID=215803 RepID=A0A2S9YUC9_9BACT|nr:HAD family hydrolase [Enhygromyxa salina]PRQ08721.1 NLI interacting factor-like phosphatase [Enhygromyxa salina]
MSAAERPFAKLLVLDLDETLIHARDRDEPPLPWPAQRQVARYHVHLRPGVREFMSSALQRFVGVGIWTSASTEYATAMLDRLVDRRRLRFIFARDRCTQVWDAEREQTYWRKDIAELHGFGFGPGSILVVDDKPKGLECSHANLIPVRPFEGDPEDLELPMLRRYLEQLGPLDDVRQADKRRWREQFEDEDFDLDVS